MIIQCVVCGKDMVKHPQGPKKKYCSHACNQKALRLRRKLGI